MNRMTHRKSTYRRSLKRERRLYFSNRRLFFAPRWPLSSVSCARRHNEIHEIHVGQKRADRSIEIDVERRSETEREGGGSEIKKNWTTGYHFISSAVELWLINALLSVCCDPARAMHEKRDGEKGGWEAERKGSACGNKIVLRRLLLYAIPSVLSCYARRNIY